jgi:hypothetical protein
MATTTIGSGPDSLVLRVSQDAFQGDAQYTVKVGGVQVGGILAASAARNAGQHDTLTLLGDWGPGNHPVNVTFLNDAYDGSGDRNLYLEGATYNGKEVAGASAAMLAAEQENFFFIEPGSGPGYTVVLADDFSRGYDSLHWGDPFPLPVPTGPTSNYGAMWNPSGVAVRDGEMQVAMTRQADGTWTVGGFNSFKAGFGILYGTVEFDARVEHVQGTMAAFLMWPTTGRLAARDRHPRDAQERGDARAALRQHQRPWRERPHGRARPVAMAPLQADLAARPGADRDGRPGGGIVELRLPGRADGVRRHGLRRHRLGRLDGRGARQLRAFGCHGALGQRRHVAVERHRLTGLRAPADRGTSSTRRLIETLGCNCNSRLGSMSPRRPASPC